MIYPASLLLAWPRVVQCVAVTTGILRHRGEDNIKVHFREMGLEEGAWTGLGGTQLESTLFYPVP
jgi:hypothetical protein